MRTLRSSLPLLLLTILLSRSLAEDCAPDPSLIGWWRAEGTAQDSADDHQGSIVGDVGFGDGKVGFGFFIESNEYLSIPETPDLNLFASSPFSLDAWVRPTHFPSNQFVPLTLTKPYYYGLLFHTDKYLRGHVSDGHRWLTVDAPYTLPRDEWTYVTQTWDGSLIHIYVNGELIGSGATPGSPDGIDSLPALIGRWEVPRRNETFAFRGSLDEVGIYSRALTAEEVAANYAAAGERRCVDEPFKRGDVNGDKLLSIVDPVRTLQYLFAEGSIECLDAADTDDDGALSISDPIELLGYLFLGTPPPTGPFTDCGFDPTIDELSCKSFSACP